MHPLIYTVRTSEDAMFYIILFVLIVIAIVAVTFYFSKRNKILRSMKKIPSKQIQLAKENEYLKIIGKAHCIDTPLISPISKRKCVYYQIKVEERSGGKNKSWHTIINEEKAIDFSIESSGEKAIVQAYSSSNYKMVHLVKDVKRESGILNDPPKFLENYLASHGKDSTGFFGFNKTMHFQEGIIEIGEEISVLGTANWKVSDHMFDKYSTQNLFISGNKTNKLLITDDPKAKV